VVSAVDKLNEEGSPSMPSSSADQPKLSFSIRCVTKLEVVAELTVAGWIVGWSSALMRIYMS